MKCVIMAGGKGTRISCVADNVPKPMIKIDGKPVLEHEIERLREQDIRDIIMTVGHLSSVIMDYFGDGSGISPATGQPFGVHIEYYEEERPLGNAGALFRLKDRLSDDFLLLNGDCMFDVDLKRFAKYHQQKGGWITLFTHPNSHPYDSGIVVTDRDNAVMQWIAKEDERPEWYKNRVNAGLHMISPKALWRKINRDKIDLDRDVLKPLAGTGHMFAYDSSEYVKDMGTAERFQNVCRDYDLHIISPKNLNRRQKAVFMDRDGTINKYVGFLKCPEDFELLPGAGEALRRINDSGYLAVIVTNQPVIARGDIDISGLESIHNKLETVLGREEAYVDKIYFCPHHPDRGYEGERSEYKIICGCRKPKPGMLFMAADEMNIDLSQSWMIGDEETDVQAGKAAGCKTALIGKAEKTSPDICVDSLLEFVEKVIGDFG